MNEGNSIRWRVLRQRFESVIQRSLNSFGFVVLRNSTFDELLESQDRGRLLEMLRFWKPDVSWTQIESAMRSSKAQLQQDVLALLSAGFRRDGYFVEFGATDGVTLSNTYLLEKNYGWTGILAEPGRMWQAALSLQRQVPIVHKAVWSKSGESMEFLEQGELSTLSGFEGSHFERQFSGKYKVETISLQDLLDSHGAPQSIDFLSLDTEGSEFEILSNFDFSKYRFGLIAVEHGRTHNRARILTLLEGAGYRRILDSVSGWDDWYVPIEPNLGS